MTKIVETKNIGFYTLSISADGAMTIQAAHLHDPLTFDAGQTQELAQWLFQQKNLLASDAISNPAIVQVSAITPVESSEEIVQRVITDAIMLAREGYPASLDLENRDRFIDQVTRDPAIRPLVAQGKVSRKQIMLWIEQQMGGTAPSLWKQQDKKRSR